MELLGRERSGSTLIMDDFELIKTLDSSQQDDASETSAVVQEMLSTYKEPWLLNTLIDYYFQTGSRGALNVLKGIKQIQAQVRECTCVILTLKVYYRVACEVALVLRMNLAV